MDPLSLAVTIALLVSFISLIIVVFHVVFQFLNYERIRRPPPPPDRHLSADAIHHSLLEHLLIGDAANEQGHNEFH